MVFTITGTIGCEKRNGQWTAYIPVIMRGEPRYLTLNTFAIPEEGWGCFNLCDVQGHSMAECQFMEGHKYMHVYRKLQQALEQAMQDGQAILSQSLQEPVIVTKDGFEAVNMV